MSRPPGAAADEVTEVPSAGLARDSAVVAAWTLVSRATGLLRVMSIGAVMGPTFLANAYQSTQALPQVVYEVLTGSLFASLLVPPMVRAFDDRDPRGAARVAGGFLGVALAVFFFVGVAVVVAGPLVMRLLGLGISDPAVAVDQRRIGVLLLALLMPQLLFYGVAGTAAAAMNARRRFALPAAAPAVENIGISVTLLVFAGMGGVGQDISDVTTSQLVVLGAGTTCAVALHAAVQWCGAAAAGVRLVPRPGWRDTDVRLLLRAARPALGHSALSAVLMLGVLVVAGSVAGGVVSFVLALNFFYLVTALTARPLATALLPRAARLHQAGDLAGVRAQLDRSLSMLAFLVVPAACCLLALAAPLSWAVTLGEMATPRGESLVAVSLAVISLSVVGEACFIVLTAGSYAQGQAAPPFHAMALRAGLTVTGMVVTLALADGAAVLVGLGLSKAAGDLCSALYLSRKVLGALPAGDGLLLPVALRGLVVGALMGTAGALVAAPARSVVDGAPGDLLAGAAAAGTATACFLLLHAALRSPELAAVLHVARGRRG